MLSTVNLLNSAGGGVMNVICSLFVLDSDVRVDTKELRDDEYKSEKWQDNNGNGDNHCPKQIRAYLLYAFFNAV